MNRCRMKFAASPARLDEGEQRIKAVYTQDDYRVLLEAAKVNVHVFDTSRMPSYQAWHAAYTDLAAMPWGAQWWCQYGGRQVVMTYKRPLQDYPCYYNIGSSVLNGLGYPQPAFQLDLCYVESPNGIMYAGFGVPVHEIGHLLDSLFGRNGKIFSQDGWWQAVWPTFKWLSPIHKKDAGEAFADSFAMWNLSRQPEGWRRLPYDVDKGIFAFWEQLAKAAGWRIEDPIPGTRDALRRRQRELRRGLDRVQSLTTRRTEK